MSNFGKNLRKIRLERNISISAISAMTGIARSTIYDWEKGRYVPSSFSSRQLLADVFQVSPFYFDHNGLEENPLIKDILVRIEKLEQQK
ncbi:MAG: hypothetical protein H6Q70_132 [Firmicutes bacterium]|nr:hypothetical protein [Ignavibacteriaceae bacterium]MBP2629504.1 hypothetical protein [Bacillota bacterium]